MRGSEDPPQVARATAIAVLGSEPERACRAAQHSPLSRAQVTFRCDATADELIDVIEGNRIYVPCLYVLNKSDAITIEVPSAPAHSRAHMHARTHEHTHTLSRALAHATRLSLSPAFRAAQPRARVRGKCPPYALVCMPTSYARHGMHSACALTVLNVCIAAGARRAVANSALRADIGAQGVEP
jgi:hypothetical protein